MTDKLKKLCCPHCGEFVDDPREHHDECAGIRKEIVTIRTFDDFMVGDRVTRRGTDGMVREDTVIGIDDSGLRFSRRIISIFDIDFVW